MVVCMRFVQEKLITQSPSRRLLDLSRVTGRYIGWLAELEVR